MKIIGILYIFMFIWFFLFGDIKIKKTTMWGIIEEDVSLLIRFILSLVGSAVFTLILGFPLLGILRLFGI